MQSKLTIQKLKENQNRSLWQNTQTKLPCNEGQTNVEMHCNHDKYSWRDIQGLSWIFEKEVYGFWLDWQLLQEELY